MKDKILNCIEVFVVGYGLGVALGVGTRNVYPCILALAWYAINKSIKDNDNQNRIAILVLSASYSLATTLYQACNAEIVKGLAEHLFGYVIMFLAFVLIWNTILHIIWKVVGNGDVFRANSVKTEDRKRLSRIAFLLIFGILFIRLLLDYPGDISNDSIGLIEQAMYDYDMHGGYPPILAIILRGCIGLAMFCGGDMNLGVFMYCLIQVIVFSLLVAFMVYRITAHGISKYYCYLICGYFVIIPYNVHFSHTIWKDTPFAICCGLFAMLVWEQTMKSIQIKSIQYWTDIIWIVISGIGMAILRANGYYALLLCIPFGVILFWKKRKDMWLVYLAMIVFAKLIMGPLNDKIIHDNNLIVYERSQQKLAQEKADTGVSDVGVEEATSANTEYIAGISEQNISQTYGQSGLYIITAQQLAAVYMNGDNLSEEEMQLLDTVFNLGELVEAYNPHVSDHTMYSLNRIDRRQYLRIWWVECLRHPLTYIKAWGDMTCGYWYPEIEERSVYIDELKQNDYGVKKVQVLPSFIYSIKEKVDRLYTRIPFYGLIWSIGLAVWSTAFCVAKTITRKGCMQAVCYMPFIGVWGTLLVATPAFGEFRYLYSIFLALPIIIAIPFVDTEEKGLS